MQCFPQIWSSLLAVGVGCGKPTNKSFPRSGDNEVRELLNVNKSCDGEDGKTTHGSRIMDANNDGDKDALTPRIEIS